MSITLVEVSNRVCPCNREIKWISNLKKVSKTWYFHNDGTPCKKMDE